MRDFSRLKIWFLAGTLEHGGAERQLFYILQALGQRGATLRVLCLDQGEFWEEPIRALGVPVTWVGQRQSRLARLARVLQELRNGPPDLFQSQHFFANAYVGLAGRLLGLGAIGALRSEGSAEWQKNGMVGGWLNLRLPPFIAANNRNVMQQAIARGFSPENLYFLPNAVDTQRFRSAGASGARPLTLLAVGRLSREKRFDRFISALGRLRDELDVEVRGWIVGPSQDQGLWCELQAQAAELGLIPGRLQFVGGVSDMAAFYQQADICVLTSDFEGTPNALLEAMASGLPVVATKVGGVPEVVRHGTTGFLVEREDMDGLVGSLAQLAGNAQQRTQMGRRAREYVELNHSLERLPAYLEGLYDVALPRRRSWKLGVVQGRPA
jgi:glycosyltransferase involved in cell wall biosynthesis